MEKGYLIGLFEGDGYIYHGKDRKYTVDFYLNSVRDKDIMRYLLHLTEKIRSPPSVRKDKRYNCVRVRVCSKQFFMFIKNRQISNSKNFAAGFISGLIDSDGYANARKSMIEVVNTNKNLLLKARELLRVLGIKSSLRPKSACAKDKKPSFNLYISVKFIDLKNVSRKIRREFKSRVEQRT